MKTIINKLRFALLLSFAAFGMIALAQNIANIEKMSISTQMLLNEIENGVSLDIKPDVKGNGPTFTIDPDKYHRSVARPVSINGETFISAFVRVNNESEIRDLEALGVKIECIFDNGLLTALIPVDKIHEIAALDGVMKINAATLMKPFTDKVRQTTNVDDVLTHSADAIAAGLPDIYDGSGVILGVIDNGIDYNHIAFKDKNGNNRISRIYNYTYTQTNNYGYPTDATATDWTGTGTMPTTDDNTEDHGTHTSSIAGGSSVIVNGTNVSVTDNHANATYGGMAPGAELYLAGIKGLYNTYIANAFQKMYQYATAQQKPLVVSNSWGGQEGPHDGTGDFADIIHSYFGDNHPNNICLFAAGNEAGTADASEGGGFHISGNASSANPLGTILRCDVSSSYDNGLIYYGDLASAWSTTDLGCRIYVLNTSNGTIETTVNVNPTTNGAAVSGLSAYYSGTLYAYKDYVNSENKKQILLYATGNSGYMQSQDFYQSGSTYKSNYTLAVEFYPINGNADIDVWAVSDFCYFTDYLTTNGHNWTAGSDDMSVDDEATFPDVISVGAYNSKTSYVNYQGSTYAANSYVLNDITYFSSYATPEESPTGLQYPWITAPGALIVSAVNHNHTSSVDDYSYYGTTSLVVNSSTNPYAIMQGTSMACPAAAGIVALWLQAAQELDKDLTTTDIKNIMAETAIHDQWTNGTNASQFGNGKINALGGIQYILGLNGGTITVDPTELTFGGSDFYAGHSQSQTVTVTNNTDEALHLTIAGLNASLSGTPFSVTAITNNGNVAADGGTVTITITYAPTVVSSNDQAILTIAENVTVALTGSCVQEPDSYAGSVNPVVGTLPYGTVTIGNAPTKTITITNEGLNPFTPVVSVSAPFTVSYDNSQLAHGQSRTITVTFTPTQETSYSETLTITAPESNDISFTYTLTGTGEAPYIAGTIDPTTLNFANKVLGQTYTDNVTITNTGTLAFTPVINTSNLPAQYTVTGNGEVAIDGSINLTVTYSPTAVGSHNGSFTVSFGNETYTVNVYGSAVEVTSATVCDGSDSNYTLPIYGNYYNNKQINQMIYPSNLLGEIQGKKITSMKFYPTIPIDFSGGEFTVKMGMTTTSAYTNSRTYSRITANMTTVKTGQVAVSGENELVITFDEPFEYTSNNLVIDFEVTATGTTTNSTTYFYGVNQNSTYRSFNSYGTSINSYGRYNNANRRAFLPKVTFEWQAPFTAGTVSPTALTFTDVRIGQESTQTVTVTNTGTLPFTPVIDTTNLPSEFTVTGNNSVAVGGTNDLMVTYTPTDEGPHSGSFTVTIGDVTYTVSVTGNGITVNSTLFSNEVMVPVYHSEAEVDYSTYIFSESEVLGDVNMGLAYPSGSAPGEVKVLAKNDEHILNYELHHKVGNGNWTYPNGNAVATANHVGNSYVVNDNTFTFPQDATEMWITMNDSQLNTAMTTYYIPVTVAKSIVENGSQDNTYGAPVVVSTSDGIDLEVSIGGYKSASKDKYGNYTGIWEGPNGINYCVYMPQVHVVCQQLGTLRPYMYRAWLLANDDITYYNFAHDSQTGFYGTTPITDLPKLLAVRSIEDVSNPTHVLLPEELGDTYEGMNTFGAPVNILDATDNPNNPGIVIAVRVYYQSADEENGHMLRGNRDGGYGFGEGRGSGNGIPTGVNELFGFGKQVVDVQYVNALGMQSREPFDGLNIVVTRYSDGSITTTKVVK